VYSISEANNIMYHMCAAVLQFGVMWGWRTNKSKLKSHLSAKQFQAHPSSLNSNIMYPILFLTI
jgi:hypothetical protein